MDIYEKMRLLYKKACEDDKLKELLLETKKSDNSLKDFCDIADSYNISISPMDIISESEYSYDAIRRSTNGGGENSPVLLIEDDLYEELIFKLKNK